MHARYSALAVSIGGWCKIKRGGWSRWQVFVLQFIWVNEKFGANRSVKVTCWLCVHDSRSAEVFLHKVDWDGSIVLRSRRYKFRLGFTSLSWWLKHKARFAAHLLFKRLHYALWLLFFWWELALTWLYADVLFHFLLPLSRSVFVFARQFSESYSWSLFGDWSVVRLIGSRSQSVARIEQEVVVLIQLCHLSWDSHSAQILIIKATWLLTGRRCVLNFWRFVCFNRGVRRAFPQLAFYLHLEGGGLRRKMAYRIVWGIYGHACEYLGSCWHFIHWVTHIREQRTSEQFCNGLILS